ncbi:unnamed protein product, partial [Owenia fusiformis]
NKHCIKHGLKAKKTRSKEKEEIPIKKKEKVTKNISSKNDQSEEFEKAIKSNPLDKTNFGVVHVKDTKSENNDIPTEPRSYISAEEIFRKDAFSREFMSFLRASASPYSTEEEAKIDTPFSKYKHDLGDKAYNNNTMPISTHKRHHDIAPLPPLDGRHDTTLIPAQNSYHDTTLIPAQEHYHDITLIPAQDSYHDTTPNITPNRHHDTTPNPTPYSHHDSTRIVTPDRHQCLNSGELKHWTSSDEEPISSFRSLFIKCKAEATRLVTPHDKRDEHFEHSQKPANVVSNQGRQPQKVYIKRENSPHVRGSSPQIHGNEALIDGILHVDSNIANQSELKINKDSNTAGNPLKGRRRSRCKAIEKIKEIVDDLNDGSDSRCSAASSTSALSITTSDPSPTKHSKRRKHKKHKRSHKRDSTTPVMYKTKEEKSHWYTDKKYEPNLHTEECTSQMGYIDVIKGEFIPIADKEYERSLLKESHKDSRAVEGKPCNPCYHEIEVITKNDNSQPGNRSEYRVIYRI